MDGLHAPTTAQDHWHVNLAEPWEVTLWQNELRCSEQDLRAAVAAAGPIAGAVQAHLARLREQGAGRRPA